MKALILVAGQSNRFWPLAQKPLFPICGKSLVEHQVERLQAGGVKDITLVASADNMSTLADLLPDVKIIEQADLTLGMRGALLSALPECGDEPVMIVGGNDVVEPTAYKALLEIAEGCDGALLAQEVDHYFPGGYLKLEGDRITNIVEKPGEGKEPSNLVNIVAHVHNHPAKLLEALNEVDESKDDQYEQALQKLFGDLEYQTAKYGGTWQAVKYPWHLLQLLPVLLNGLDKPQIHKSAEVHPTAVIDGNVIIEEGTRVMAHATVKGPCYIGKNCIVANNSLTRGSSVGDNCVVGFNTEVKDSVLAADVWTHMTYLGDSVVGHNVSFGGGTITGNLRFDEGSITSLVNDEVVDTQLNKFGNVIGDNCRFGIQVGMNPGIKVGAGTFVNGGSFINNDVPAGSFVGMKGGEMVVKENREVVLGAADRSMFRDKIGG